MAESSTCKDELREQARGLMTAKLAASFAKRGSQEESRDPIVVAHYFAPGASNWWATEYDTRYKEFFGYVQLGLGPECDEWGYFALDELAGLQVPQRIKFPSGKVCGFTLPVERDLHFEPRPISQVVPAAVAWR